MKPELMNKWCKTTSSTSIKYYIKVKKVLTNSDGFNTLYGELVNPSYKHFYEKEGHWSNQIFENTMVEVPISEIAKYLPYSVNIIFKIYI